MLLCETRAKIQKVYGILDLQSTIGFANQHFFNAKIPSELDLDVISRFVICGFIKQGLLCHKPDEQNRQHHLRIYQFELHSYNVQTIFENFE